MGRYACIYLKSMMQPEARELGILRLRPDSRQSPCAAGPRSVIRTDRHCIRMRPRVSDFGAQSCVEELALFDGPSLFSLFLPGMLSLHSRAAAACACSELHTRTADRLRGVREFWRSYVRGPADVSLSCNTAGPKRHFGANPGCADRPCPGIPKLSTRPSPNISPIARTLRCILYTHAKKNQTHTECA